MLRDERKRNTNVEEMIKDERKRYARDEKQLLDQVKLLTSKTKAVSILGGWWFLGGAMFYISMVQQYLVLKTWIVCVPSSPVFAPKQRFGNLFLFFINWTNVFSSFFDMQKSLKWL